MSNKRIVMKQIEHSNNGGNTNVKVVKQQIVIRYDTFGLQEGYYTTFLGINAPGSIDKEDMLQFQVKTESNLSMNLDLILTMDANTKLKDNSYVLFQPSTSAETWILPVEDGTFKISGGMEGTLSLPLKNLENTQAASYESLGFIIVLPENSSTGLTIKNPKIMKDTTKASFLGTYCVMQGEDQAEIPTLGEYVYDYVLHMENLDAREVKYSLVSAHDGVSMSEDGRLTVTSEAESKEIGIKVEVNSEISYQTTVNLVHPWYVEQNMPLFDLPKEFEVVNYTQQEDGIAIRYSTTVQTAISVILLAFIAFYFVIVKTQKEKETRD